MPSPSSSLLSRVVRLVRSNPAKRSIEADEQSTTGPASDYSRDALEAMVERKQRNDVVRRRELNMLRKLRRCNDPTLAADLVAPFSFFDSSLLPKVDDSAQERTVTLKKIDEIEAQMALQWRNRRMEGPTTQPLPWDESKKTAASRLQAEPGFYRHSLASDLQPTRPPLQRGGVSTISPDFLSSSTRRQALDVDEMTHDTEVEEAAIRFANADAVGAQVCLLDAMESRAGDEEIWRTLLDLYRVTGQQVSFERAAIEYAACTGRAPPPWVDLGCVQSESHASVPAVLARSQAHWAAPAVLTVAALTALEQTLTRAPMPWCLDWSGLQQVQGDAVAMFYQTVQSWDQAELELHFMGEAQLLTVLAQATPSADNAVDAMRWSLRMEVLRLMHQLDEFEMVALDYCVTYEISPPSWEAPRSSYQAIATPNEVAQQASTLRTFVIGQNLSADAAEQGYLFELCGEVQGDVTPLLEGLTLQCEQFPAGTTLAVNCAQLIRMDFAAAGALLNWVATLQTKGYAVRLQDVHRLIAAFFHVIGIYQHAIVVPRVD